MAQPPSQVPERGREGRSPGGAGDPADGERPDHHGDGVGDTIAAIATPPGPGALAVVRLTGPSAHRIVEALTGREVRSIRGREARLLPLRDPDDGSLLDRGVVTLYHAPASYTGEDMAELSTHGGWLVPALVLEACFGLGAREAEPGEFTRRAYLNGKLDLVQAEAVADLVSGRSRALHGAAVHQMERGLSRRLGELRERVVEVESLLVHHVDFPDEDEPPVPIGRIMAGARELVDALGSLLATAPEGELLREGALTVFAGPPNSGKSSLFNALLGQERAIVTEVPGTTRDALEAVASIGGFPFRLVDTAGLRTTDERVEKLGIEVARGMQSRADILLFCREAGEDAEGGDGGEKAFLEQAPPGVPVIVLRTKADLAGPRRREGREGGEAEGGEDARIVSRIAVSAVTGEGLDEVRGLLPKLVYRGLAEARGDVPVLTRARQTRGVRTAAAQVVEFIAALEDGIPADVAGSHLREAAVALEEVLGVIPLDQVLDRVFRDFCIGK